MTLSVQREERESDGHALGEVSDVIVNLIDRFDDGWKREAGDKVFMGEEAKRLEKDSRKSFLKITLTVVCP